MFESILVPLDGSALAEAAVHAAEAIARRFGSHITLLHVAEPNAPKKVHGERHLGSVEEAGNYLKQLAERLTNGGIETRWHVHENRERTVAEAIAVHDKEFHPDLIVVCSHGTASSGRLFIGSIGQRVAGFTTVPVFIVRPDWTPPSDFAWRSILVPLDGVPEHESGMPLAEALAKESGGALRLVLIVPTLATAPGRLSGISRLMPGSVMRSFEMQAGVGSEYIDAAAEAVTARGVASTAEVLRGDPSRKVCAVAKSWPADLVVLSTHGKEGLRAFWSGSVAHRVCSFTPVPVLLVPAERHEPASGS